MSDRVDVGNLRVARVLYDFITNEALPGTGVDADAFWAGVDKVVTDLAPRNRELLERRDDLQTQVDRWHRQRAIEPLDGAAYQDFLTEIGYLVPEPEDFTITTANVDDEITTTAGPQLVVPILNARFALNAANARWGSLYDALYGTDVIPEADGAEKASADTGGYNKVRGDKVIAYAREVLDGAAPLASGSWKDAVGLKIDDGQLLVELGDEFSTGLQNPDQFVGYTGKLGKPQWSVLLINHGLHIEVLIDPDSPIGSTDKGRHQGCGAGVGDHHDHGLRGLCRGRGRRGQGARVPKLVGPQQGRPVRRGVQGRQDVHPRAQRGPCLHHPRRQGRADAARSQPAIRPQRRSSDDQ
ncbi:malate synthase family protein [Mycobacteroides abscessus 1948]|uniref:Malate synthase family protein n=1 Tax=Mycobacteroides abscessus 1948 TaxID=1299323 RepID=A0A829QFE7_9MYCO|nr:malate synthase family protein [Mycobacteroides abscessus 1948]